MIPESDYQFAIKTLSSLPQPFTIAQVSAKWAVPYFLINMILAECVRRGDVSQNAENYFVKRLIHGTSDS